MNFVFEDIKNLLNFVACPDFNPSGIARFALSPLVSAANIFYVQNSQSSPMKFIPLSESPEHYIISTCVNHSPDDWTGYDPKVNPIFYHLNKKYLKDLQNKRALLLLDQSFEGYQTPWLWDFFHKQCVEYSIPPSTIVYVTGNMIADKVYKDWADANNIEERMKIIGYVHFELDIALSCLNRREDPLPTFQNHIEHKKTETVKTFACLNKRIRPHRVWFYNYLFYSRLLSHGLVSMNVFNQHGYNWEGKSMSMDTIKEISSILPLNVYNVPNDVYDDNYYIRRFNDRVCLDTYVSVISEAHCGDSDETLFLSEKTFKPIACHHPFIIMGNKDSLSKMKELGYWTFEGYIDESYDSLPTHERMKSIINSIQNIDGIQYKLEWFRMMEEIIEHNYNTLINKTSRPPDSFVELMDYYNKFFKLESSLFTKKYV